MTLLQTAGFKRFFELQHKQEHLSILSRFSDEVEELSKSLALIGFHAEESDNDAASTDFEQVSHGRRIEVALTNGLRTDHVQLLNALFAAETELVDEMHDWALQDLFEEKRARPHQERMQVKSLCAAERMKLLKIATESVKGLTDDLIEHNNVAQRIEPRPVSAARYPSWVQAILEDFFKICDQPNLLEAMMLADVANTRMVEIMEWFTLKRKENKEARQIMGRLLNKAGSRARARLLRYSVAVWACGSRLPTGHMPKTSLQAASELQGAVVGGS